MRKHYVAIKFFFLLIPVFFALPASGEIVYLKNGKVIKGAIVKEGKTGITVRTDAGNRDVRISEIKRILYGNMDMEQVYILMQDGRIIKGFLVDQDDKKLILRENRNSPDEKTISKSEIRQISRDSIYPVDLELFLKPSLFLPMDSGGAELKPSLLYGFGIGFNSMLAANLRLLVESGYLRAGSGNTGQYLQVIPVTLSAVYNLKIGKFNFFPKLGAGMGVMEFDTGEGEVLKSNALEGLAGAGITYEIRHRVRLGVWGEYVVFYDKSDYLQSALFSISCHYML